MGLMDYFRSKKRLAIENDDLYFRVEYLRCVLLSANNETLGEIQEDIEKERTREMRILPGSDIGLGKVRTSHWAGAVLAQGFANVLKDYDAENFITIDFVAPEGQRITVTVQNSEGITPSDKLKELETKIKELEEEQINVSGVSEMLC